MAHTSHNVGMVGVIRTNNYNSNILLFANFFLIPVFFLLPLLFTVHPLWVFIVFAHIHKTVLLQQYSAICRIVGVIRKHSAIQLLLLFASFF
jgi:hypothetical protein